MMGWGFTVVATLNVDSSVKVGRDCVSQYMQASMSGHASWLALLRRKNKLVRPTAQLVGYTPVVELVCGGRRGRAMVTKLLRFLSGVTV